MKRLSKAFVIALGAVVLLCAIALLGVNLYVQSAGVQKHVEDELSRALGVPITIQGSSVTPFGGLKLSGVAIPDTREGKEGAFLRASSVRVRFRFISLFRRQLVMDEIALNDPRLVWGQSGKGKWTLPVREAQAPVTHPPEISPEPPPAPKESPPVAVTPVPTLPPPVEPKPVHRPAREAARKAGEPSKPLFDVEVREFRVNRGSFEFRGEDERPLLALAGIDVVAAVSGKTEVEGTATSAQTTLVNKFLLSDVRAPFKFSSSEVLTVQNLSAGFGGGKMGGNLHVETADSDTPFSLKLEFAGVQLERLLAESGVPMIRGSGSVEGSVDLRGRARKREDLAGQGQIILTNGQIDQYPLLQTVGHALQIPELERLEFSTAEARFTVEKGNINVDALLLQSKNLQLDARGRIRRDGKLNFNARLTIDRAILRQLPAPIEDNFAAIPDSEKRYVDFKVGGTLEKPDTNLVEMVLGRKIESEVAGLLEKLWGKGTKEGKTENKKADQPAGN